MQEGIRKTARWWSTNKSARASKAVDAEADVGANCDDVAGECGNPVRIPATERRAWPLRHLAKLAQVLHFKAGIALE